jgi:hypothetical protein
MVLKWGYSASGLGFAAPPLTVTGSGIYIVIIALYGQMPSALTWYGMLHPD